MLFIASALGQAPAAQPSAQAHHGTVVFSRSGVSPAEAPPQPAEEAAPPALAASITDAMRSAPAFTAYDFTVHLQPVAAALQVELRATLRNDGPEPLAALPLQLGASLHFEHIRSAGKALRFAVHRLESDADHTGALEEAAIALPAPLAPGAQASFVIDYAGTIAPSSARLDRLGAPAPVAAQTDWDRISEGFTGLRGFGDTVWYPVASVPALLGDGAKLFHEIGRQKQRDSAAVVSMAVTVEFAGEAPNVAVLDGRRIPLGVPASLPQEGFPGVERISLPPTPLGFNTLSLVLATRAEASASPLVSVATLPAHDQAAPDYTAAAGLLDPLFRDWLGPKPARPLLLVDLPLEQAAPAEDGDALLLSLVGGEPAQLAGSLSGPLAGVYFQSPRAWLREGVAGLMRVLWTERTVGRDKALEQLGGDRTALALAEPASPGVAGVSGGQPLISSQDAVFYRTKATYVLWMLRTLAGDAALGSALRAYNPAQDTTPDYFESLLRHSIAAQPPAGRQAPAQSPAGIAAGGNQDERSTDLQWFFKNWVYEDPGLPDLAIRNVFSNRIAPASEQWLVAVEVANSGYADAEVPVTVRSASTNTTVQLRVPARGNVSRRILLLGEPTEVEVNDGSVPEVEASVHRRVIE